MYIYIVDIEIDDVLTSLSQIFINFINNFRQKRVWPLGLGLGLGLGNGYGESGDGDGD